MSFLFDDRDTVDDSDNAENDTWDNIARAKDPARHGRFQDGLFKEMFSLETEITGESYHERISGRDFNHKWHNKRVKGRNRERKRRYVNHIHGGPRAVYRPLPPPLISFPGFPGIKDYCRQKTG